jgi:hypothetical protein
LRITMPINAEKLRRLRRQPGSGNLCIILQRTLLGFWPYGARRDALM